MFSKSTISPTVSQPASRTRSTTPRTSSTLKAMCRSPGRFAAGAGSCAPAEGEWKRTTSNTSLPSGPRAMATSTVTLSRPMIRSIHSPLSMFGLPHSKPSSARNLMVSSRSSTTRPMWTKSVTPGRWLSIEVKTTRSRSRAAGVMTLSAARAERDRRPHGDAVRFASVPFTLRNLKQDLQDVGSNFDGAPDLEFRLATKALELERSGLGYQRVPPDYRFPYGHTHEKQEEVYVVVRGSGRMKLDDDIVELREWDVVRVPPGTWRGYEAGSEGLEILVFGAPSLGEDPRGDVEGRRDWWAG